jgi:hypothetical protein
MNKDKTHATLSDKRSAAKSMLDKGVRALAKKTLAKALKDARPMIAGGEHCPQCRSAWGGAWRSCQRCGYINGTSPNPLASVVNNLPSKSGQSA